jgi:hypothetical protein
MTGVAPTTTASRFGITANNLNLGMRRLLRFTLVAILGLFGVTASADDAGSVFESTLSSSGAGRILDRGMRVFGGFLVIGGIAMTINGFTGRDEGYEKAVKIGIGVLALALGMYFVKEGSKAFSIDSMLA